MSLKTYIVLAIVALLAFGSWLWLGPNWSSALLIGYTTLTLSFSLAILYAIARLFRAVVHRLER